MKANAEFGCGTMRRPHSRAVSVLGALAKSENGVEFRNIERANERHKKRGHRVIIIITSGGCVPLARYGNAQLVLLCERTLRDLSVLLCHSAINLYSL